jgi:hypothetical protein
MSSDTELWSDKCFLQNSEANEITQLYKWPPKQSRNLVIEVLNIQMSSKLRVLLLGATGNLGVRLIPALLSHNHAVIAYVRNPTKLKTILKPELLSPITIVEGDATDTAAMYRAIVEHDCNALICAAGNVVMNPWGKANLPGISEAAADAAILAAKERGGKPLRCWFLGGMSLLDYPRSTYFLADL